MSTFPLGKKQRLRTFCILDLSMDDNSRKLLTKIVVLLLTFPVVFYVVSLAIIRLGITNELYKLAIFFLTTALYFIIIIYLKKRNKKKNGI